MPEPLVCARCGAPLALGSRFCPQCGAPVEAATTEERKVVTVLFADLAQSTELATGLDPERFREVIAAFYEAVLTELESLRGRAEKFAGDAVMAVFGLPHAHDDDAIRAVHAALRIRDRTKRIGEMQGVPLHVRIGINTGPVAAGSGPAGQFLVSGATVNLAARLQTAGDPGEILVGETTRHLTAHAVRYGDGRTVPAKGFDEAVPAYTVEALTTRSTRRTLPLVGRRRELALLGDSFDRARETSRAHMVTVLGEAGIGKSRLVEEFVAAVPEGTRVLTGRTTEFEEDPTFSALAEMLRREIGVKRDSPRQDVSKLLHDMIAGCCDPPEVDRIAARLGLVLGLGEQSQSNKYEVAEIRTGLMALIEGLTEAGPVVLIFEDLEIARPGLLDLIEQVVARAKRLPILVVCAARDGLLELRPTWGGGISDSLTIRLEPLPDRDGGELARAAGSGLDEQQIERVVQHSGGNPFFIVETTGMLMTEHAEHIHGALALPPTVQAVVASRIDHLPARGRDLVRKASVFPRSMFNLSELELVTTPDETLLDELEDDELLVRDDKRAGVWRFRHEMLRDVAYETLPKRERMRLHLAVADGLPEKERYPSVVAYHLEQAARASLDLNPSDRSLADRAVEALGIAASAQRRRIQSRNAIELYERALALAGPPENWGQREARMLSGIGEARYWKGEYEEALGVLERALALAPEDPWTRAHAYRFVGDINLNVKGNLSRAEWTFDEALAASRELDDPWAIGRTLLMAAWAPYARGDLETSHSMLEEALVTARSDGDRWAEARALSFLAVVCTPTGNANDVLGLAQESLQVGREMDDQFSMAVAQQEVAVTLRRLGRLDEALSQASESLRGFQEIGAPWEQASVLGDRGNILRLLGRIDEAEGDLREALTICRNLGERTLGSWTAGELARLLARRGALSEAQSLLRHPSTQVATEERAAQAWLSTTAGILSLEAGDRNAAAASFREALAAERDRGWPNQMAGLTWFVARRLDEDTAGGENAVEKARELLERNDWRLVLDHPELDPV